MFKHVTKSRKLAKHQREARLSDEDSSGASASEPELDSDASGSDGSDSEGSDSDSEFEQDEPQTPEEEEELLSPAPGYPSIEQAVVDPIALPTHEEGRDGELVEKEGLAPVCVVCVNKVLKAGTMLEVHKKSKDHLRRHARFVAHVKSDEFDPSHLPLDAVSLVARLDANIANRAAPAPAPAPSTSTSAPAAAPTQEELAATAEAERLSSAQKNAALKAKAAAEGRAKREVLREAKQARNLKKREARNEKKDRLKARAARKEVEVKEGEAEGEVPAVKKRKAKKVWGVKPTDEEIAARQAKKVAAREAAGIPPPIHPTPKTIWADQLIENNDKAETAKIDTPEKAKPSKKRSRPAKATKA